MELKSFLEMVPFSGKRVLPFKYEKKYLSTGGLVGENLKFDVITYQNRPSRADIEVYENDIIFARMKDTNKVLCVDKSLEGIIVSTGFSVHKVSEHIDCNYIVQILKHNLFVRQKNKFSTGAIQPAITNSGIKKIKVPIPYKNGKPDLLTQKRIAKVLSDAEQLIAKRKQSIDMLDEFIKSTFLDMFGDPAYNHKNFNVTKIKSIVKEVKYGTSQSAKGGKYPYLRMNNIDYNGYWDFSSLKHIDVDEKEKSKYILEKGDVVFNRTNSKELVGKTGIYSLDESMIIAGYLIRIRVKEDINPYFLWGHFNSAFTKTRLFNLCRNIVGMANINAQELQKIPIVCPPFELQNKFATIVKKTENIKEKFKYSLTELENLYNSLSQKAFKGELDLSNVKIIEDDDFNKKENIY